MITTIKFDFETRRSLADYSAEEVEFLDHMHKVLTDFNAAVPEDYDSELNFPDYTEDERAAYSHFRQLLIQERLQSE